ncbi:MAG: hypothetical protein PHE79_08540 [Eubacteriales bacterium]|nr:hypothetical protein [Eubacteriales bacterium]
MSEVVKQTMVQLVARKEKGDEEAGKRLCKLGLFLRQAHKITAEEHAMILIVATERGPRPSDKGFWTACKCWLKRFFSWE